MHTLTLCGLKAELLAGNTTKAHAVFALEETSAADVDKAIALLVSPGMSYAVVHPNTRADHMALAMLPAYSPSGLDLMVFWNADRYNDAQTAVMEKALADHMGGTTVLVHGHDLTGTPLADLLDRHNAQWARFDLEPTPVLFRVEKKGDFKGHLTAVFPTIPGTNDPYTFTVYAHVGQHSSGSHGWYVGTRAATEAEYAGLAQELERIGYLLNVRKRWTQSFDATRRAAIQSMAA
jgi:hypothetical protein